MKLTWKGRGQTSMCMLNRDEQVFNVSEIQSTFNSEHEENKSLQRTQIQYQLN